MTKQVILNPVTRISGFMEIEVFIKNNVVMDAKTKGLLFRGFEKMLLGRSPFDAVYFTERICGICSTAHATASSLALEDALNIVPAEQGRYLRDIIHGCEYMQNHIRHFYQYTIPDFVKMPEIPPLYSVEHEDFRLPEKDNRAIVNHYFESLAMSRNSHEMLAVLGGKVPHSHGVFIGGITTEATTDKIIKLKSLLQEIKRFIEDKMIPDVYTIAEYYNDYYHLGGGCGNLLSYGVFNDYEALGTLYVDPLVYTKGNTAVFNPDKITENIDYSWYDGGKSTYSPFERVPDDDMHKAKAYSWVKASRYESAPFETGPLARQWLSGEYRNGISSLDRTIARVLEAKKVAQVLDTLLDNIIPGLSLQEEYTIPDNAQGKGLVDTTRGSLGHWLKIRDQVIAFYQVITPSVWNLSTRDENGIIGVAEKALIGTPVRNAKNPIELGRIIRSFDPCVSCATHVYSPGCKTKTIQVVP